MILLFLELNDIKWCFNLKEIIFDTDLLKMELENVSNSSTNSLNDKN